MRVALTGATSDIGRHVVRELGSAGHEALCLVRSPRAESHVRYDVREPVPPGLLEGVDALIHLAWDWEDRPGDHVNLLAGRRLAIECERAGVKPVLLSTFSAFSAGSSFYGLSKLSLEREFTPLKGVALRAGLIWGTGMKSGMMETVSRLASVRRFCPHLLPDPDLHHSHADRLAQLLVSTASSEDGDSVVLAAAPQTVRLSEIVHAARPARASLHVRVPVAPLATTASLLERSGVKLPFRSDSLRATGKQAQEDVLACGLSWAGQFPGRQEFLAWVEAEAGKKSTVHSS